ncbi:L-fucose kinase [Oopsacas minuta]|uniref:L-fucose kinase n=1 Tax=Oopsacas minuta TaxID=111878 RepID=A0AAV7JTQ9_9METZ|nr:L-fucose kinase [Oopsacas minuta]
MSWAWTVIAVTAPTRDSALAFQAELVIRQKKGIINRETAIITVDDPKPRIGSGSATLNALLLVSELLSSKAGFKIMRTEVFQTARVLILHAGRLFPFASCGRAFSTLPLKNHLTNAPNLLTEYSELPCEIDQLISFLQNYLCHNAGPGVWVCSTGMVLHLSADRVALDLTDMTGVKIFATKADPSYAKDHGVCRLSSSDPEVVEDILFQVDDLKECIMEDGTVPLISGVVFLSHQFVEKLLSLHAIPPLDACTYIGLDSGAQPLSISLFFDILRCMTYSVKLDQFIESTSTLRNRFEFDPISPLTETIKKARAILWRELRSTRLTACLLPGVEHKYPLLIANELLSVYRQIAPQHTHSRVVVIDSPVDIELDNQTFKTSLSIENAKLEEKDHSFPVVSTIENCILINSRLEGQVSIGEGSLVLHCHIEGNLQFGKRNILIELEPTIFQPYDNISSYPAVFPDDIMLQQVLLKFLPEKQPTPVCTSLLTVFGIYDNLILPVNDVTATFLNKPWEMFFSRTGIIPDDLWGLDIEADKKFLFKAKLFPVALLEGESMLSFITWLIGVNDRDLVSKWRDQWRMSMEQVLRHVSYAKTMDNRRNLTFQIGLEEMSEALVNGSPRYFLSFFRGSFHEGREVEVLKKLDEVASSLDDVIILCRVFSCIADVLGIMAGEAGGIRGGPAANANWNHAFSLIQQGKYRNAVRELASERNDWLDRPDRNLRASRHYERAAQILTSIGVLSVKQFIKGSSSGRIEIGKTLKVTCASRIDWAGGWSDTPPITYEIGGAVLDFAIEIEGRKPIVVFVKRIPEYKLELVESDGESEKEIICTELQEISDYNQPYAFASLLKACFVCTGILEYPSTRSLAHQLRDKLDSGVRVVSITYLPQGSGLGTSSILAGAILAGLWRLTGVMHDNLSLSHAVLHLEQLLTTGGGWQDQCGGIFPGAKLSSTSKGLPLKITVEEILISEEIIDKFNRHFVLVYTGKTRLARNLLQDVLRNWHARLPAIVLNVNDLALNARASVEALRNGDFVKLGKCLSMSGMHKLIMAPGSMPLRIELFIDQVKDDLLGYQMAGAGGGGFMILLTKEPNQQEKMNTILGNIPEMSGARVYPAVFSRTGLEYEILD